MHEAYTVLTQTPFRQELNVDEKQDHDMARA